MPLSIGWKLNVEKIAVPSNKPKNGQPNADANLVVPDSGTKLTRFPGDAVRDRQVPPSPRERERINHQYRPEAKRVPHKKRAVSNAVGKTVRYGNHVKHPPLEVEEQIGYLVVLQLVADYALVRCHHCDQVTEWMRVPLLKSFKHSRRDPLAACSSCREARQRQRKNEREKQRNART